MREGQKLPDVKPLERAAQEPLFSILLSLWRGPLNLAIEKTVKTAANRLSLEPEKGHFVYIIEIYKTPGNQTCYEFQRF